MSSEVYLADFGLAKGVDQQERDITQTGCLIGTPEYMAPELAEEAFSKSCDIYALGVLLYQMVTGQMPFTGSTPLSVYWKHIQEQPVVPSLLNPAIPHSVEEVILCALEKDPRRRFSSAKELADAYLQAIHGAPTKPIRIRVLPLVQGGLVDTSVVGMLHRSGGMMGARHNSSRMLAVAVLCVFMVVSSLSLGFFVSQREGQDKASGILGASVQLPLLEKTQQRNPTPTLGEPPTTSVIEDANNAQSLPVHVQGPPRKTPQNQRPNHKPKHHKGDATSPTLKCGSVPIGIDLECGPNSNGVESGAPVLG